MMIIVDINTNDLNHDDTYDNSAINTGQQPIGYTPSTRDVHKTFSGRPKR